MAVTIRITTYTDSSNTEKSVVAHRSYRKVAPADLARHIISHTENAAGAPVPVSSELRAEGLIAVAVCDGRRVELRLETADTADQRGYFDRAVKIAAAASEGGPPTVGSYARALTTVR
jgi:hypothetical protein